MQESSDLTLPLLLRVVDAPEAGDFGREFPIDSSPLLLGRGNDCPIRLLDRSLSRHHAKLETVPEGLRVTDLGSLNGLWVDNELTLTSTLKPGDTFLVGATTLVLATESREAGETATLSPTLAQAVRDRQGIAVAGNRPFFLTDPDGAWLVTQGMVNLFADVFVNGQPEGSREYVGTIETGGLLLGQALPRGTGWGFWVSGRVGTEIRPISRALLRECSADPRRSADFGSAASAWARALHRGLETFGTAKISPEPSQESGEETIVLASGHSPLLGLWPMLTQLPLAVLEAAALSHQRREEAERVQQRLHRELLDRMDLDTEQMLGKAGENEPRFRPALGLEATDLLFHTFFEVARQARIEIDSAPPIASRSFDEEVVAIAEASQVRVRKVALRGSWWCRDHGPLLARRNDGSPLALLPGRRGYRAADCRSGKTDPVTPDLAETIYPFAFMLYRPLPPGPVDSFWKFLRFATTGLRSNAVELGLTGALLGVLGSCVPLFTGWLIDEAVTAADRSLLFQCALGLFVLSIVSPLLKAFENLLALRLEGRVDMTLQAAIWDRLLSLPARFFRDALAGDLADRVSGIHRIRDLIAKAGRTAILGGISGLFYMTLMISYDLRLAAFGILTAVVLVTISLGLAGGELRWRRLLADREGAVSAILFQLLSGIGKIRVAAAESQVLHVWARRFRDQLDATVRASRWHNWGTVSQSVFPIAAPMALFLAAVPAADSRARTLSPGHFVGFLTAFGLFAMATLNVGEVVSRVSEVIPIYRRLSKILAAETEIDIEKQDPGELEGEIWISHVSFRYSAEGPLILKNVDLRIKPGEFVALVGESGSGKSTLLRLLLGFEQPEAGAIYYDGQDLNKLNRRSVRRQMGVVLQTSKPFAADILENIVGASHRGHEEALEAARLAGFDHDIEQMPMRWNTYVGEEGANLSGGQRQRLMIARALLNRPRILLMDEATSALDNRTQSTVAESLDGLKATRVVVAHRLSTIRNADRIVVFADGQVEAEGDFEELLKRSITFARLARRQML